jgi:hypothetical protein
MEHVCSVAAARWQGNAITILWVKMQTDTPWKDGRAF